jgi:caspase domain-containing protein
VQRPSGGSGGGLDACLFTVLYHARIVQGRHAAGKGTFLRRRFLLAWAGLLLALLVTSAQAERRLAFVAGIDRYPNLPRDMQLERAVADAEAVGNALAPIGFQVTRLTGDVSQATFLRRFRIFAQGVQRGDTVLFFFSGHGVGLDGANYLLPPMSPSWMRATNP